ncbi:hypothetical protein ACHQM5_001362 [Ranunculus cassubicifolius]
MPHKTSTNQNSKLLKPTTESEDKMEGRLLLDVVISKGTTIFQLLSSKNKTLLIWRDAFLVLNLSLHIVNGIGALHLQSDSLPSKSLDKDLHPTTQTKHQMQS